MNTDYPCSHSRLLLGFAVCIMFIISSSYNPFIYFRF